MNTYMMKSPVYYAVSIQGFQNKSGWYLCGETEDELIEFAKMVKADIHWNMRTGVLSFTDRSEGVKLDRPEHVKIGDVVAAYDDWGTWRVEVWSSEEFEKKFIKKDIRLCHETVPGSYTLRQKGTVSIVDPTETNRLVVSYDGKGNFNVTPQHKDWVNNIS